LTSNEQISRFNAGKDRAAPDAGLAGVAIIARYFRIAAEPDQLRHDLALLNGPAAVEDLVLAANQIGLKARIVTKVDATRLAALPLPAILQLDDGRFVVLSGGAGQGLVRVIDPLEKSNRPSSVEEIAALSSGTIVLFARRPFGPGTSPGGFDVAWFLPSLLRYRRPLALVLLASVFVQFLAILTPLLFQIVIDKVLVHKAMATLMVLTIGMVAIVTFETALQILRSYILAHTANRMDAELARRLFRHLFRLPLRYFETRAAGQTFARVRELETIRSFWTGQAIFSIIDFVFAFVYICVLFVYSVQLALIVVLSIPLFVGIAALLRPLLRRQIVEKFARGARSQQLLLEAIIGARTVKAASVEPLVQSEWEERLAAYLGTSFKATMIGVAGQNTIQYVSKLVTALILCWGAQLVIDGQLTVGELIAFNMIAGQVAQPILRLSQLWQDFQQVAISIDRLGDILNSPPEPSPSIPIFPQAVRGAVELSNVTFRYAPDSADVLRNVNIRVEPGQVIGIVGLSGSGKSTLAKLLQRLYAPQSGIVKLDGVDMSQFDPGWLRRQIGAVLQESILFNRSIHDNIALGNPAMSRAEVIHVAKLVGADEFIARLPDSYDAIVEERGANLSGGQRQRIAFARALAANPRVLILDEATSALDYESERIIQQNMKSIVHGRTVVIIAHRLAALRTCSKIYGMHNGVIIEEGSHDELLKRPGGLYARLWAIQEGSGSRSA
jgi:subfamily B ATP-binding cassette protein HlyB/CyaB